MWLPRWVVVVVCWLVVVGCAGSGGDRERSLEAGLRRTVEDVLSQRLIPGASVAVIDRGGPTAVAAGVAVVETGEAATPETPFRTASVSKLYLAALALDLVERGHLRLDDPIGTLPLALPAHLADARAFTLRHLLAHTSGLTQTFTRDEDRHQALSPADQLNRIPTARACAPGGCWSYADGDAVLVGLVIEAATGRPLREVFRDVLADPLELRRTRLVDETDTQPLPAQYALVSDDRGHPRAPKRLFQQALPRTTGVVTTAEDAATFGHALFTGRLLRPQTLTLMLDASVMRALPCESPCPFPHGLGVFHYQLAGHRLVGHDGGSGAIVVHDEERSRTIALLTNGGEQDTGRFLQALLETIDQMA